MAMVIAIPPLATATKTDRDVPVAIPAECNGCSTAVGQLPQYPGVDLDFHSFDGNTCFPVDPDCWQCDPDDEYGCHGSEATGSCSYWVGSCYHDGEEPLADDISSLVEARDDLDYEHLARLLHRYPNSLKVNRERNSIQMLNCKGAVVGNLSIEGMSELHAALAEQ
jgi:hypothetical protein